LRGGWGKVRVAEGKKRGGRDPRGARAREKGGNGLLTGEGAAGRCKVCGEGKREDRGGEGGHRVEIVLRFGEDWSQGLVSRGVNRRAKRTFRGGGRPGEKTLMRKKG